MRALRLSHSRSWLLAVVPLLVACGGGVAAAATEARPGPGRALR